MAWNGGGLRYPDWIKTLTPEELEAHLLERKQRKAIKKAMKEVVAHHQAEWITAFHNTMGKMLKEAADEGDAQKLAILYDRIVGKPDETVEIDMNKVLPWNDEDIS